MSRWVAGLRHTLPDRVAWSLAQARRRLGLSQQAVADRVGVSRRMVGLLEDGSRAPSVEVAVRMALVLKLSDGDRDRLLGHAQLAGRSSPHRSADWG